jgi:hypothetical protein
MKTIRILIGLLLLWAGIFAGWADELDFSKQKEINRSFTVSLNDQLIVENRNGDISISYWEKNEVGIRVVVESKAVTERRAQETLDKVQIELEKSGNTVYGITSFKSNLGGGQQALNVHYYITMPHKLPLTLSVRYGGINLPEKNEGKCNLEVKYGNLKAGSFTEPVNISAQYGNVGLGDTKSLRMEVRHCGNVSLRDCQTLYIDSKFSDTKLRNADKLYIDSSHGDIQVENVNSISIEMRFGNARIGYVKDELNINALDHSSMTVNKLDAGFRSAYAESRFSTLKLSISPQASFIVAAEAMRFGNLDITGLKITESKIGNSNYYYRINDGNDTRRIRFEGNNHSTLKINAF